MKRLVLLFIALLFSAWALAAVNINTATKEELDALPEIGPVKAQAIIDYRSANGPFKTPEDVMKVNGIKEGTFAKIKGMIATTGATTPVAGTASKAEPKMAPAAPAMKSAPTPPAAPAMKSAPTPSAAPTATAALPAKAAAATAAPATAPAAAPMTKAEQAKADKAAKAEAKAKAKEEKAAAAKAKKDAEAADAKAKKDAKAAAKASAKDAKAAKDAAKDATKDTASKK